MREVEVKVEAVGVSMLCDLSACGGELVHDGGPMSLSNPPQFSHTCSQCGSQAYLNEKYPTVRFKRV